MSNRGNDDNNNNDGGNDKSLRWWVRKIKSRMHPDNYSLAISLTTKIEPTLSAYQNSRYSSLD